MQTAEVHSSFHRSMAETHMAYLKSMEAFLARMPGGPAVQVPSIPMPAFEPIQAPRVSMPAPEPPRSATALCAGRYFLGALFFFWLSPVLRQGGR